jgi:hypothetical protein
LDFADRIVAALNEQGFEGLIDRRDTASFQPWWEEIELRIRRADSVVFVLTPEAVSSKGRQRHAGRGNIGPMGGNISVGPYSSTRTAGDVSGLTIPMVFEPDRAQAKPSTVR